MGQLGPILRGTITERTIAREDSEGRHEKIYGPYCQWTWKRSDKTVTVNLSKPQARIYQRAIDEHRKLKRILAEMRALSHQILQATTPSVIKRKGKK